MLQTGEGPSRAFYSPSILVKLRKGSLKALFSSPLHCQQPLPLSTYLWHMTWLGGKRLQDGGLKFCQVLTRCLAQMEESRPGGPEHRWTSAWVLSVPIWLQKWQRQQLQIALQIIGKLLFYQLMGAAWYGIAVWALALDHQWRSISPN